MNLEGGSRVIFEYIIPVLASFRITSLGAQNPASYLRYTMQKS
jgi:hypothetical protein